MILYDYTTRILMKSLKKKLHGNKHAAYCFEQILEATLHKIAVV